MFFNKRFKFIALGLTVLVLMMMAVPSVFAADVAWTKNGTTGGKCNTMTVDSTVTQGQQRWLFILTSSMASGPYNLTAVFSPATNPSPIVVDGIKKGNGAVHFTVYTGENATLVSATATGGTIGKGGSVLTVSHCQVNPPPLQVNKTANTSFVRTHTWDIQKSVDVNYHDLPYLGSGTSNYAVVVTGYSADSDWAVAGGISVHNSSAFAAIVTSITDEISGFGLASVSCPVAFPYNLASGDTLNCTYSTWLPDGSNRTNTAASTTSGIVPGGSGSANVIFGNPTTIVGYPTVTLSDTYVGNLGSFSGTGGTANYSRTFNCQQDAGDHPNTATINETGQSSSASVHVNCAPPPQIYWCSPGFWSQNLNVTVQYVDLSILYSTIGGAPLKNTAPQNPTIGEVLSSASTYGGAARNSVADYISAQAFGANAGTQYDVEHCPLNAHGDWVG